MEYLWLAILVAIILRAFGRQPIGRQPGRYKPRGKFDVPREGLPYNEKEMPYAEKEMPPAGFPAGEPGERRREFNVPPDPARRGGDLTHAGANTDMRGASEARPVCAAPAAVIVTKELSYGSRRRAGGAPSKCRPSRGCEHLGGCLRRPGPAGSNKRHGLVSILGPRGGQTQTFQYR